MSKPKILMHTRPVDANVDQLATFLAALTAAHTVATQRGYHGVIHVAVQFGSDDGKQVCGTIESSNDGGVGIADDDECDANKN